MSRTLMVFVLLSALVAFFACPVWAGPNEPSCHGGDHDIPESHYGGDVNNVDGLDDGDGSCVVDPIGQELQVFVGDDWDALLVAAWLEILGF